MNTQLKNIVLSTEMMDADAINSTFIHKDGTVDIGCINLSNCFTVDENKTFLRDGYLSIDFWTRQGNHHVSQKQGENAIAMLGGVAEGKKSIAIGSLSDENGWNRAIAAGENSFACGYWAEVSGDNAAAFNQAKALGKHSFAVNAGITESTAKYGFATGDYTKAVGQYSVAMGCGDSADLTEASAEGSFAIGRCVKTIGNYSFSIGNNISANHTRSVVIGNYQSSNGNSTITFGTTNGAKDIYINKTSLNELYGPTMTLKYANGYETTINTTDFGITLDPKKQLSDIYDYSLLTEIDATRAINFKYVASNAFGTTEKQCQSIQSIRLPNTISTLIEQSFIGCKNLRYLNCPSVIAINPPGQAFNKVQSLSSICIPDLLNIPPYAFNYSNICILDFRGKRTTYIPEMKKSSLSSMNKFDDLSIIVPESLYDEWITQPYWNDVSAKIIKES